MLYALAAHPDSLPALACTLQVRLLTQNKLPVPDMLALTQSQPHRWVWRRGSMMELQDRPYPALLLCQ